MSSSRACTKLSQHPGSSIRMGAWIALFFSYAFLLAPHVPSKKNPDIFSQKGARVYSREVPDFDKWVKTQDPKDLHLHRCLVTSLFQISFSKMGLEHSITAWELFHSKHNDHITCSQPTFQFKAWHIFVSFVYRKRLTVSSVKKNKPMGHANLPS